MADIELLKRLAEAAAQGEYESEQDWDDGELFNVLAPTDLRVKAGPVMKTIATCNDPEQAEFFAAANPATVSALIAENERLRQIISDSATACGAAMSPECTVEFMGHLPAEIAGVLGQLRAELERVRADAERLRKLLTECTDSLESEILDRYGLSKDHPAMRRKFECDMQEVIDARAAMGKGGGQNGTKTAETRASAGLEGGAKNSKGGRTDG